MTFSSHVNSISYVTRRGHRCVVDSVGPKIAFGALNLLLDLVRMAKIWRRRKRRRDLYPPI